MNALLDGDAAMPYPETSRPESPARQVLDFMQHRLEHALRQRVRYRYVQPRVLRVGDGYRVESPCCSRNVDSQGGVIDIALLTPVQPRGWQLHARDHANGTWMPQHESEQLDELLDLLCVDAQRLFWP